METDLKYYVPPMQTLPNGNSYNLHRRLMCKYIGDFDGTEIGDAIKHLTIAANILYGVSSDYEAEATLLLAEKLCREYLVWLREKHDPEAYEEISEEVFKHFTGGAQKI
jgi:hypothetical protein